MNHKHKWVAATKVGLWADFVATPPPRPDVTARRVISVDSKVVGVDYGQHGIRFELCAFTAVDVLTNEIVLNCIVVSLGHVTDCNTERSGISERLIVEA